MIVYQGPSLIDGNPIVGVLTGLAKASSNPKTGAMAQLWIMVADEHPLGAIRSEADASICGDCKWRGHDGGQQRGCYVNVGQAPSNVWKKAARGGYGELDLEGALEALSASRRGVRLGAYGDPAALPLDLLEALTAGRNHTGYTHLWRREWVQPYRSLLMASVDSPQEFEEARRLGWRTFRVRLAEEPLVKGLEVVCPASEEAGHRTTCDACTLCNGVRGDDRRKSIIIMAHGSGAKAVQLFRRGDAGLSTLSGRD